mmetsp:Transcript_26272/g.84538  ORF Transcript_26272/g.84538 Transcript_26272/m.84538 type:complete len:252 (-) Transcript_26272:389-1144(-)
MSSDLPRKRFEGKRVAVTGAGKGIGREIAKKIAEEGGTVVAMSRTLSDLEELQTELGEEQCEIIECDMGDPESAKAAAERAGACHGLVNNAAISVLQPFLETSHEVLSKMFSINVQGVLLVSQVIAARMIKEGIHGSIVNVSSQASQRALQDHTSYCVTKGALDQLTRCMAFELGPHSIRVNSIHPTVTMTAMGKMAWGDAAKAGPMLARIPLGKFAQTSDVASAVAFLLSDESDMIHGAFLPIDGGFWVA